MLPTDKKGPGRPKIDNNAAGIPKPVPERIFSKKTRYEKKKKILQMILDPTFDCTNVLTKEYMIQIEDLPQNQDLLPSEILSVYIDVELLKNHFEKNAFSHLQKLMAEKRRKRKSFVCTICSEIVIKKDRASCASCLKIMHNKCATEIEEVKLCSDC